MCSIICDFVVIAQWHYCVQFMKRSFLLGSRGSLNATYLHNNSGKTANLKDWLACSIRASTNSSSKIILSTDNVGILFGNVNTTESANSAPPMNNLSLYLVVILVVFWHSSVFKKSC